MIWLIVADRPDWPVLGVAESLEETCDIAMIEEEANHLESWIRPQGGDHGSDRFVRRGTFPISVCRGSRGRDNIFGPIVLTPPSAS